MHAPTFAQFLIGAMAASSALAFQVAHFARVGSALALVAAAPSMALPAPGTEADAASVEKRHHKGKRTRNGAAGGGRNRNNARDVEELEKRHHKGKRTRNGAGGRNRNQRRQAQDSDTDGDVSDNDLSDDDEGFSSDDGVARRSLDIMKRHHKGKRTRNGAGAGGGRNRNQRRQIDDDEVFSDDDEDDHSVARRSTTEGAAAVKKRHHKGKRTRNGAAGGRNRNQRRQLNNTDSEDNGLTSNDDDGGLTSDDGGLSDGFSSDDGLARPNPAALPRVRVRPAQKRDTEVSARDPELEGLQARHHKGKRTRNGGNRGGN
ncbi:hypothetical protein V8F06_008818 [Rhypophila decipiens]